MKAAKAAAQAARATAKAVATGVKAAVKATIAAVKAIIAATKALIAAIAAGGLGCSCCDYRYLSDRPDCRLVLRYLLFKRGQRIRSDHAGSRSGNQYRISNTA